MKTFDYVITDPVGIHARPAGQLVKVVKELAGAGSAITVTKGDKTVDARKLMALMGMGIKQGDTITVGIEGGDEECVACKLEEFFKENL
ncbi:MAG: HPr family phosphocarrier protein [Lachnospiraceae bacterium]|nr:HPr family phosphocarrier protein [Lachnospiraceae bacterium]